VGNPPEGGLLLPRGGGAGVVGGGAELESGVAGLGGDREEEGGGAAGDGEGRPVGDAPLEVEASNSTSERPGL
jgi:hypothetical protein